MFKGRELQPVDLVRTKPSAAFPSQMLAAICYKKALPWLTVRHQQTLERW